jgi:predicted HAD superfamily Cof-like phosphohydrolase
MLETKRVIDWNVKAGNLQGDIDYELEVNMLKEELMETMVAMNNNDKIEIVDGLIDLIYVATGTLHKLGLDNTQIIQCFHEVCDSNDSKMPFEKDVDGKIKKSKNYFKPNLKRFL